MKGVYKPQELEEEAPDEPEGGEGNESPEEANKEESELDFRIKLQFY